MTHGEILPDATADELREVIFDEIRHDWPDDQNRRHQNLQRKLDEIRTRRLLSECQELQRMMERNMDSRKELVDNPVKWLESAEEWTRLNNLWTEAMAKIDKIREGT